MVPPIVPDGPDMLRTAESCTVVPATTVPVVRQVPAGGPLPVQSVSTVWGCASAWLQAWMSVSRLLEHVTPVGAKTKSLRVASIEGDDRDSVISAPTHGTATPRSVRSAPISENVGGRSPPVLVVQLPSPGFHGV